MRSRRSILLAATTIVIIVLALGPFNGLLPADAARGGRSRAPEAGGGQGPRASGGVGSSTSTASTSVTTVPATSTTTTTAVSTTSTAGVGPGDAGTTEGSDLPAGTQPWKGVFLPHGWVATAKSDAQIRSSTAAVGAAGFSEQILNIGVLDDGGVVPEADYAGLARWVAVSRDAAPRQRIYAWVNGTASEQLVRTELQPAIARGLRSLLTTYRLDGVILDIEPFDHDDPRYLSLLRAVRSELPNAWIGVTAPLERWSDAYITEVGRTVDGLMPMAYDTSLTTVPNYVWTVAASLTRYRAALAPSAARVLPILPAYSANPWHDPTVENIPTASDAITAAGGVSGAAAYWWWEMTETDIAAWRAAFP